MNPASRVLNRYVIRFRNSLVDPRIREFWVLGIVSIFIHGVLDPVTTYFAVIVVDAGFEANTLFTGYLQEGPLAFFLAHLPLYVIFTVILFAFTVLFSTASETETDQLQTISRIGWSVVILWGSLVVLNNLRVLL